MTVAKINAVNHRMLRIREFFCFQPQLISCVKYSGRRYKVRAKSNRKNYSFQQRLKQHE